jgi:hypothetical protein
VPLPRFRKKPTIGKQIAAMKRNFPSFKYCGKFGNLTWHGELQPTDSSPKYSVRIDYRINVSPPEVQVLSPEIREDAPHRYSNGSLCLYYPKDGSWTLDNMVAEIVPWAAVWLYCYELWLTDGRWYREESPHTGCKS